MEITNPHPIQEKILRRLGYDAPKSFSTLQGDTPSNKVSFHLDKLQEKDLIKKSGEKYELTSRGVEVLPYLKVENIERPIVVVDLFLMSDEKVYLERKEETDSLDATAGYIRPPSTRARKDAALHERARQLYLDRFDGDLPDLSLQAVFESTTRFENGAGQDHILFYIGAEIEGSGDRWWRAKEMDERDFLPGMETAVRTLIDAEDVVHGIWDLIYTGTGVELDRLDILQS